MDHQTIKSTPKDVFLHLFNILTFYLSAIGIITLYIQYITALFPDNLNYYFYAISQGVRWATSVLFIAVPAYLLSAWLLGKDLATNPIKREFKLRKWLIYFTLFVSAVTIIIDLIIFVYNFLNGELTIQFGLKVFTVLVVAGAVFGYYLWELKRTDTKTNVTKILATIVGVFTLGSIIAGFFIIGTPGDQRKLRFDEERTRDLDELQSMVNNHWSAEEKLPTTLADISERNIKSGYMVIPTDPETKQEYSYQKLDDLNYELCANFSLASNDKIYGERDIVPASSYGPAYGQNWQHTAGNNCFTRAIDPAMFKPQKVEIVD